MSSSRITVLVFSFLTIPLICISNAQAEEATRECAAGTPKIVDGAEVCCLPGIEGKEICCSKLNEDGTGCEGDDEGECEAGETAEQSAYIVVPATCNGDSCDGEGASIDYNSYVEHFRAKYKCVNGKFEQECWEAGYVKYSCDSEEKECSTGSGRDKEEFSIDAPKVIKTGDGQDPFSNC